MTLSLAAPPPTPLATQQRRAARAVEMAVRATASLSEREAADPRVVAAIGELIAAAERLAAARPSARACALPTEAQP